MTQLKTITADMLGSDFENISTPLRKIFRASLKDNYKDSKSADTYLSQLGLTDNGKPFKGMIIEPLAQNIVSPMYMTSPLDAFEFRKKNCRRDKLKVALVFLEMKYRPESRLKHLSCINEVLRIYGDEISQDDIHLVIIYGPEVKTNEVP
ncbi:MAG: hypothetical protein LBE27_05065 [Deltaproteobacteria bacterium]|jgi:hypothetical protein|nr:hypothetical protein [Deltaproteobacteria bacterium]